MRHRPLGRSGLSTAPLVFGGNVFGWTADEATSHRLLDAFVDGGFNAVDTADVYSAWAPGHAGGESEGVIGRWLKASGKRDKVLILTKVAMWPRQPGLSAANIEVAVEGSLKRLQTDYIDLYQARAAPHAALARHAPAPAEPRCSGRMCMSRSAGDRARPAGDVACDSPHLDPREIGGRSGEIGGRSGEVSSSAPAPPSPSRGAPAPRAACSGGRCRWRRWRSARRPAA